MNTLHINMDHRRGAATLAHGLFAAALAFGVPLIMAPQASAQSMMPPVPALIAAPSGNTLLGFGRAIGTQGYVCLPGGGGVSWTVKGARPEATVFADFFGHERQILTHFLSPNTNPNDAAPNPLPFGSVTWQNSFDSSRVWGQTMNAIPAGSDPACPNAGAIPCVLLQSIGSEQGPAGGKSMTRVSYIQRLNTNGGTAPADGCSTQADVGTQVLVPYTADYYFFRADQQAAAQ